MPRGKPVPYDPKYCDELVEHCAEGHTITGFAGRIRVSRRLLDSWADQHLDFKEAMAVARAAYADWFEKQGRNILMNGGTGGQATLWIFKSKNLIPEDYRERVEVTGGEGKPLFDDTDPKRLAATVIELLRDATGQKVEKIKIIKGFGENEEGKP
jgi:hypothetical protein